MTFALQVRYHAPERPPVTGCDSPVILMIDRHRRLLDCTPTGSLMLDGQGLLACEFGRITVNLRHDQARLDHSIHIAMEEGSADLSLAGRWAEIVRLGSANGEGRLLLIFRRVEDGTRHVEQAAQRFGLTSAEHRLLKLLFEGMSLAGAALSLGIARTTARTHLQRIFDKTGSRRQSDLVRCVAFGNGLEVQ
ncbi:helix-turn-helix transcriptional regulator [Sphingomonas koreensis]